MNGTLNAHGAYSAVVYKSKKKVRVLGGEHAGGIPSLSSSGKSSLPFTSATASSSFTPGQAPEADGGSSMDAKADNNADVELLNKEASAATKKRGRSVI